MASNDQRPLDSASLRKSPPSTSNHRAILHNIPEIIVLIGAEGHIRYVNPQTEKVLAYSADELLGRNIFDFVHPDDIPRAAQEFAETIQQGGERIPSVLRVRDAGGEWLPFEIVANSRLDDPDIQAVIFTAHDLRFQRSIEDVISRVNADFAKSLEERTTELAKINAELRIENQARRQFESQLQRTVSLLNATLDSTADGMLVVSNEEKITSCNRKFIEMWRLGCESAVGKADQSLLAQVIDQLQNPNDFIEKVRALYADPSATSFDVLHFKDGRIFERYSQPQYIGDKIVGRVWSFRDVTMARNLELELRQSQKMEALGRLAGGIAHDFNNLLMLISGYVGQLLENPSLAEEGHLTCEQILATTQRAASVTRQLLAFSRKLPNAPIVADLNLIVLDIERMLRRLLSDQVRLQISVNIEPQPVYVDVSQIEVMIMNLVINAQDAMPEGGLLCISTQQAIRNGTAAPENGKTYSVLEVRDTGHGMTPEIQSHIFDPFFTTKQVGKGTGLGLSTVFGIVERSGGHIEVQSEPGQGATFRVFLPRATATSIAAPTATQFVSPAIGGHETILLAEDESGIRAMTRAYLESMGYNVIEAADGSEAIARSREYGGVIHLVLTDMLMPGIRGDTAVTEIRKQRPNIKAIFMSGYTDQNGAANIGEILPKPFEFPELARRLRSALDSPPSNATISPQNPAA